MSVLLWLHLVVAGSLMPVPPATIHHGPCPAALPATVSCAYQGTSEIYLVQRDAEELLHELGHLTEAWLTVADKRLATRLLGFPAGTAWSNPSMDDTPQEVYADGYAVCALGRQLSTGYLLRGRSRWRLCRLIRQAEGS